MFLVVSELVTNALRYGGGTCTLDLTAHPDSIEVAVHDRSPQAPRPATPQEPFSPGEGVGVQPVESGQAADEGAAISCRAGGTAREQRPAGPF